MVHRVGKGRVDFVFLYHPHLYDTDPGAQVGLGLLLLATCAKKLGASVRVINAQTATIKQAIDMVPECGYLMMYGCLIDYSILMVIAEGTKSKAESILIGGPIGNYPPDTNTSDNYLFVNGYGEDLITSLVSGEFDDLDLTRLTYSVNNYPFPDRSLIEGPFGGKIFKRSDSQTSTTLLTSRGCKYNCAFCTSGSDKFCEEYDMDRIEKELEHCLSLGIRDIRISDDNMLHNRERLSCLCNLFKEAGVRWRGSIRTYPNGIELYEMMAESGCEELSFGVESGHGAILRLLNKNNSVTHNTTAMWNAKRAGIYTRALMMMGTPGEVRDTLARNICWVEQAKPDMVSLKMFIPYPGTDIYHNPKKYKCKIHLPLREINNSAYRPDNSNPEANIDSEELYDVELTRQFLEMRDWLEMKGLANRG